MRVRASLPGGDREREELRAVGHGGVDRALAAACPQGECPVRAGQADEGAHERACAQGNEGGAQGGCGAGREGQAGEDQPGDAGGGLAQTEEADLWGHARQGESARDRFAGGSQGVQGRGPGSPGPPGELGRGLLTDPPLGDAGRERQVARGQGPPDKGDSADQEEGHEDVQGAQGPGVHSVPPRFLGSVLSLPRAFIAR